MNENLMDIYIIRSITLYALTLNLSPQLCSQMWPASTCQKKHTMLPPTYNSLSYCQTNEQY